jgi:hypothetical protein
VRRARVGREGRASAREPENLGRRLAAGLHDRGRPVVTGGDALEGEGRRLEGAGDHGLRLDGRELLESVELGADWWRLGECKELAEGEAESAGALGEVGLGVQERVEDGVEGFVVVHGRSVAS